MFIFVDVVVAVVKLSVLFNSRTEIAAKKKPASSYSCQPQSEE